MKHKSTVFFWAISLAYATYRGGYAGAYLGLGVVAVILVSFAAGRKTGLFSRWSLKQFVGALGVAILLSVGFYAALWATLTGGLIVGLFFRGGLLAYLLIYLGNRVPLLKVSTWSRQVKVAVGIAMFVVCPLGTFVFVAGPDALSEAAKAGNMPLVQVLLLANFDVDAVGKQNQPALIEAAMEGHLSIVKAILDKGANPNISNEFGLTALMQAAGRGKTEVVEALLSAGANPNKARSDGWTPLMQAAYLGKHDDNTAIVKLLLANGANVDAVDNKGNSALAVAEENQLTEITLLLREAGTH